MTKDAVVVDTTSWPEDIADMENPEALGILVKSLYEGAGLETTREECLEASRGEPFSLGLFKDRTVGVLYERGRLYGRGSYDAHAGEGAFDRAVGLAREVWSRTQAPYKVLKLGLARILKVSDNRVGLDVRAQDSGGVLVVVWVGRNAVFLKNLDALDEVGYGCLLYEAARLGARGVRG